MLGPYCMLGVLALLIHYALLQLIKGLWCGSSFEEFSFEPIVTEMCLKRWMWEHLNSSFSNHKWLPYVCWIFYVWVEPHQLCTPLLPLTLLLFPLTSNVYWLPALQLPYLYLFSSSPGRKLANYISQTPLPTASSLCLPMGGFDRRLGGGKENWNKLFPSNFWGSVSSYATASVMKWP